jgi:hypothetical protein
LLTVYGFTPLNDSLDTLICRKFASVQHHAVLGPSVVLTTLNMVPIREFESLDVVATLLYPASVFDAIRADDLDVQ